MDLDTAAGLLKRALAQASAGERRTILARLSSADPWYSRVMRVLGEAWCVRGELLARLTKLINGCELVIEAASAASASHPDTARLTAGAALAQATIADLTGDTDRRDASIRLLVQAASGAGLASRERIELLWRLASALRSRARPEI